MRDVERRWEEVLLHWRCSLTFHTPCCLGQTSFFLDHTYHHSSHDHSYYLAHNPCPLDRPTHSYPCHGRSSRVFVPCLFFDHISRYLLYLDDISCHLDLDQHRYHDLSCISFHLYLDHSYRYLYLDLGHRSRYLDHNCLYLARSYRGLFSYLGSTTQTLPRWVARSTRCSYAYRGRGTRRVSY